MRLAHEAFAPSDQERDFAGRLVHAYEEALRKGVGVIEFEGRMVDGPVYRQALLTLKG